VSSGHYPDPDFFAQRELAGTLAIHVNRNAGDDDGLFDLATVEPDPAELRVVREAHARATALGLMLPPYPGTVVYFVVGRGSAVGGQTRKRDDGVIEMRFVTGQSLAWLRSLALHELQHVDQFATGRAASMSVEEREWEATAFAWNAMLGWKP
jgi:hypothetical protein